MIFDVADESHSPECLKFLGILKSEAVITLKGQSHEKVCCRLSATIVQTGGFSMYVKPVPLIFKMLL
jgi:hypothetical protein